MASLAIQEYMDMIPAVKHSPQKFLWSSYDKEADNPTTEFGINNLVISDLTPGKGIRQSFQWQEIYIQPLHFPLKGRGRMRRYHDVFAFGIQGAKCPQGSWIEGGHAPFALDGIYNL